MKINYLFALLFFVLVASQAYQQIKLQKDEYGFTVGDKNGDLHLEFFVDFLCHNSKKSYQALTQVINAIDFKKNNIKLTYQFSPSSWHFHSYKITQAFFAVLQKLEAQQAEKFMAYIFQNQDEFSQLKWANKKILDFFQFLAEKISQLTKIDKKKIRSELISGDSWNTARYHWKYSISSHGISSTPIFNMNSVRIDNAETFDFENWIVFLKQYKKIELPNLLVDSFNRQIINAKGNK